MVELDCNSWLHLSTQDADLTLAASGLPPAVDCGWVEQMQPFILALSEPGARILDPFSGWGTTLLAAARCGRQALGVEIEADRVRASRKRLQTLQLDAWAQVIHGDSRQLPLPADSIDLCLSSVPYFGPWKEQDWQQQSQAPGQCYRQTHYAEYLQILDAVFAEVTRVLKPGGWFVAMAENLRIDEQFVPLAWDCGRLLQHHLLLGDERIISYDRPRSGPVGLRSNRAHEYALLARKPHG